VLPYARVGLIGAVVLGLGRAIGESGGAQLTLGTLPMLAMLNVFGAIVELCGMTTSQPQT
jgi:ABC-type phosphate transport system permease subunit